MKSFTRACLIFSGVVIAIGLVLTIIGGALGAGSSFANMVQNGRFSFNWGNNSTIVSDKDLVDFNDEFNNIEELSIDLQYAELNIETIDGNAYQVKAYNVLKGFTCKEENGKLIIKDTRKNNWRIGFGNNNHPTVTLYIPNNASFDKVNIDIGAGSVNANNFVTSKLSIDLGAGEFEGYSITAKDSNISVGAGSLVIDQFVTDKIDMDCGTGKLEINGSINGNADIESGLGNITLSLDNKESDFNYDIDCGIGNVIVGEQSIGGVATKRTISNDADYTMDIECGVGSIEINFTNSL
jgi:Toastrack DUF4097